MLANSAPRLSWPSSNGRSTARTRNLRDRNDRRERVENRDQILPILTRIVVLMSSLLADPIWKTEFVSKSDSYKAWIGSQEAKQTSKASPQKQVKFHLRASGLTERC